MKWIVSISFEMERILFLLCSSELENKRGMYLLMELLLQNSSSAKTFNEG